MVARVQRWPKCYEGDKLYSDCISGPVYRKKGFPGTVAMSNNPRLIGEAIIMIQNGHSLKLPLQSYNYWTAWLVTNVETRSWSQCRKHLFVDCSAANGTYIINSFHQGSGATEGRGQEDWNNTVPSGQDRTTTLMSSWELCFSAQDLHEIKPVKIQGLEKQGFTSIYVQLRSY